MPYKNIFKIEYSFNFCVLLIKGIRQGMYQILVNIFFGAKIKVCHDCKLIRK